MRSIGRSGSALHPQTRRHLLNTQRLRAAAIREFARHGLHGTKVSSIVAAAQLTQPTFYRTWPSKEAAFESIITGTLETWWDAAAHILAEPGTSTLRERLQTGLHNLYALLMDDPELTRLVLEENNKNPDRYEPFIQIYTRTFQDAQTRGLINTDIPAESLAQAYVGLTERFFLARLHTAQTTVDDAVQEVTRLILPLMTPRSPDAPSSPVRCPPD